MTSVLPKEDLVDQMAKVMAFSQDGEGTWPYDWDIADQEQYRSLAKAVLSVFSIVKRDDK